MTSLDIPKLNQELRRLRQTSVGSQMDESPGVALLRDVLSKTTEPHDRFALYTLLGGELRLDGSFESALEWAKTCFKEFGDIPSRNGLARAFLELGRNDQAVKEFDAAFASALETNILVNYIFGEFMRAAVKMKDIRLIDIVAKKYLSSDVPQSREDCAFETDWFDAAKALGVKARSLGALRKHAERKLYAAASLSRS